MQTSFPRGSGSARRLCRSVAAQFGEVRQFNMMFKTQVGAVPEDESSIVYLRPETAGGIFVNFKNVVDSFHPKLPFGIAQIGKAIRNEIAPRDFIFRVREMEQMEIEYFVRPADWEGSSLKEWRQVFSPIFGRAIGISRRDPIHESRFRDGRPRALLETNDRLRVRFSVRPQRAIRSRIPHLNFDLSAHAKASGQDLSVSWTMIKQASDSFRMSSSRHSASIALFSQILTMRLYAKTK